MTHADFYVTSATIIPIFLLAVTLQVRVWRSYWGIARRLRMPPATITAAKVFACAPAAYLAAVAIVGEAMAINALSSQQDVAGNRGTIDLALYSLLVSTGLGLVLELIERISADNDTKDQ